MVWLDTCQHILPNYLKVTGVYVILYTSDGYFNPEVVKYRQLCAKSQRKRKMFSIQQYYHRLLKQILVSRKVNYNVLCIHTEMQAYIYLGHLVLGTSWVCGPQWTGLSTKTQVTLQNSGRITGAKGEKKIESHIKGGQSWVWRQQRLIWWWWFVNNFFFNLFQILLCTLTVFVSRPALNKKKFLQTFHCGIKHHNPRPPPHPVSHCGFFPVFPPRTWRVPVSGLRCGTLFYIVCRISSACDSTY